VSETGVSDSADRAELLGGADLEAEQALQEGGVAEALLGGALQLLGQALGSGGEPQVGEVGAELLVDGGLLAHRATWASAW
jgi:hypothetical protein